MPTLPSALTRGSIAATSTAPGDWFVIEHAGGLYRISRVAMADAIGLSGYLVIGGNAGVERSLIFRTGAQSRFYVGINSTAEAGGDTGSKFFLNGTTDTGSYKFTAFEVDRALMEIKTWVKAYFPNMGTTASAANVVLDGTGHLLRSTSSEDYKTAIEPLESWRADQLVDEAQPIWYRSLAPADDPEWSWYGLSAEQMAAIDPRLVQWSYRPSDYEETPVYQTTEGETRQVGVDRRLKEDAVKVPDGVAYERLTVMLLDVVRREKAKVAALQDALAALTARLDALEA